MTTGKALPAFERNGEHVVLTVQGDYTDNDATTDDLSAQLAALEPEQLNRILCTVFHDQGDPFMKALAESTRLAEENARLREELEGAEGG